MRKTLLIAAAALPLAACATYGSGYGYDRYGYDRYSSNYGRYSYNPILGAIGALGGA